MQILKHLYFQPHQCFPHFKAFKYLVEFGIWRRKWQHKQHWKQKDRTFSFLWLFLHHIFVCSMKTNLITTHQPKFKWTFFQTWTYKKCFHKIDVADGFKSIVLGTQFVFQSEMLNGGRFSKMAATSEGSIISRFFSWCLLLEMMRIIKIKGPACCTIFMFQLVFRISFYFVKIWQFWLLKRLKYATQIKFGKHFVKDVLKTSKWLFLFQRTSFLQLHLKQAFSVRFKMAEIDFGN